MRAACNRNVTRRAVALFLIVVTMFGALNGLVQGDLSSFGGNAPIVPSTNALLFGSSGVVKIDIPKPGIAVRIEIPREFLQGVVSGENDTHFIKSNIRNDYYYYNVVDESAHWTYGWARTANGTASDGACFKPNFSFYDPNAPYCIEIWNYLNYPKFNQTVTDTKVDYCADKNQDKYVFNCFTAPKFVMFHDLASPSLAGLYNFTLFIANRTNTLGYPDFVHAYNTTLFVPVSMAYNAGNIVGQICDGGGVPLTCASGFGPIRGKGIVYAKSASTGSIVARAYVNQTSCNQMTGSGCGMFKLTGLAPGDYQVEGSAGVDRGVAYSLTPYNYPSPTTTHVSPNSVTSGIILPLRRAPLVCGLINYENVNGALIPSLTGHPYLPAAGFGFENPRFELNVTVEGTDPFGHVFRYENESTGTSSDSFNLTTGMDVKYIGTDPYGTEFAGLPAPEDVGPSGYKVDVRIWVSGYVQTTQTGQFETETALVFQSPGSGSPPTCPNPTGTTFSPNPVIMHAGGVISGLLQFCNSPALTQSCNLESPEDGEKSLPISPFTGALFGGNIIIQAFDSLGVLRGVTIINGTVSSGKTFYSPSIRRNNGNCLDDSNCTLRFYVTGFSEYYNHSLSGTWDEHDYGLPDGTYTLHVYVRGYQLTFTSPSAITITTGSNQTATVDLTRGGAFQVLVGSFDNRFGTRAIQARMQWRFLNSTIPVRARVYFYASSGATVGYVEALMNATKDGVTIPNEVGVISFTSFNFKVVFAGQNWSLREIWYYGDVPTWVTNDTYTIKAYTLGYVRQFPNGIVLANQLVGFAQGLVTLFIANEIDITVPIFANPQILTNIPEYDHAIGQVFSGSLFGAETSNLTAGIPTLGFNIYGFGAMQLSNFTRCITPVLLVGKQHICGQGHFFYVDPGGAQFFDYGLDVGTYTAALPEFGFLTHFFQVLTLPVITFSDLLLQKGVFLQIIRMAVLMQGPNSAVQGFCSDGHHTQSCLGLTSSDVAPLSWAQVQASNSTYSKTASTFDGLYDGVGALFLPAGTYTITFSDTTQYTSQTVTTFSVQWGGSYSLSPQPPLCPTGTTCP